MHAGVQEPSHEPGIVRPQGLAAGEGIGDRRGLAGGQAVEIAHNSQVKPDTGSGCFVEISLLKALVGWHSSFEWELPL